ncbi:MAG: CBS domain-containing protein [Tannerella sp.]|jgi:CBS domain containing-hemolysin-like protein|nr:CBS domain-containing protein [Tannerella sp.]
MNAEVVVAALCLLVLVLGFATLLAAAENAVSSLSQEDMSRVEESASARDRHIVWMTDHLRLMKAACNVICSALLLVVEALCIYAPIASGSFEPGWIVFVIAVVVAAALWTVFYGIEPKIFRNHKLTVARTLAPLLRFVVRIGTPFVHLSGIPVESDEESRKGKTPLDGEAPGDVYEEQEMLDEIIHFYNKKANEIMTPRTDIEALDVKSDIKEVISMIVDSGYSRIPVYQRSEDNIRGVLFAKDIIPALSGREAFEWQSLIRQPFYVPESKKIYDLLNELRANKTHIAIVVDEFGCTSGLVTMEDIVEEIIGDIADEYDEDVDSFMTLPDGSYIFEGKTQLNDFFRETGVPSADFGELTDEAETLTGLLLAIKGTLPMRRDVIDYRNYRFRILEADDRRVLKVKFSIIIITQKK